MKKVVSGLLTKIKAEIAETNCLSNDKSTGKCEAVFQKNDHQVCNIEVMEKPWLKQRTVRLKDCKEIPNLNLMVLRSVVFKAFTMASKEGVTDIPSCAFCSIINGTDTSKIVHQDDDVVAFPDIKPASDRHFLVVSRSHIPNPKALDSSNKALVEHMIQVAQDLLKEHDPELTNSRFGFHWPPFNTVSHLHLHAINPVDKMNFMSKMIFKPESYWFVSPEYVLSRL